MMMASLPSYHEATARPHWISIVATYVSPTDYTRLCLVNHQFCVEFGPRIWKDPLRTIRLLNCVSADGWSHFPPAPAAQHANPRALTLAADTARLEYFLTRHLKKLRPATRSLVLCLDFRDLDLDSHNLFEQHRWNEANTTQGSSKFASALPNLRSIILDGAPDWLVHALARDLETNPEPSANLACLMFSAAKVGVYRPAFLRSPHVQSLVYLDVSCAPVPLKPTILAAPLPCLRILKLRGRELGNELARSLFSVYKRQLWSLDLSDNKLTDAILEPMVLSCFPATSARIATHFDVEGRLKWTRRTGNSWYGDFIYTEESELSAVFSHPRRHLADPPVYTPHAEQEHTARRHDGRRHIRRDSAGSVKQVLLGKPEHLPVTLDHVREHDICLAHGGITHLRLNGNGLTLHGVERMIRESPGQLEHFECDAALIQLPRATSSIDSSRCFPSPWLSAARLKGFIGASHLFRPVYCPNLQVLRVHHSLVTQVPSIDWENVSLGQSLWIAETFIEPRARLAFPQIFAPDMNPRLYSLTLTDVPRYSKGPVIEKIINFVRQASVQEREIRDTDAAHAHRVSATLRGLRHLHLEFGPDPHEAAPDILDLEDLDAKGILGTEDGQFSFFGESGWAESSSARPSDRQLWNCDDEQGEKDSDDDDDDDDELSHAETPLSRPPNPPPYRPGYAETADRFEPHRGVWNGQAFSVPVWVGRGGIPGPHRAVNEYQRILGDPYLAVGMRASVGPASPSQVLAGVPAGSYIYHAAWDAMLAPPAMRRPTQAELEGMRDVVAAVKEYRGQTKAALAAARRAAGRVDVPPGEPHFHWSGKLEVSLPSVSYSSGMWR